jgi:transforming growth factor-beta-induced protein
MKTLSIISSALLFIAMMSFTSNAQYQTASAEAEIESAEISSDIVDIAATDERFTTLAYLLESTGLTEALRNGETYTIFAPTDDAFAEIPEETLNQLMDDQDALREVLLSHVVVGEVTSDEVVNLEKAKVASGETLRVKNGGDYVKVANAKVVEADIMAANGVIHAVDSVIMPEKDKDRDRDRDRSYGER